jgi:hypothetical protein
VALTAVTASLHPQPLDQTCGVIHRWVDAFQYWQKASSDAKYDRTHSATITTHSASDPAASTLNRRRFTADILPRGSLVGGKGGPFGSR